MAIQKSKVIGDKELIARMRIISQAVSGRPLDDLCKESLEPMRAETQSNARVLRQPGTNPKGGHLDQGVAVGKREQRGRGYRIFWLGFRNRARRIAHLVEFGTLPHYQPRRRVMHPGARPKPFIRPAFDSKKGDVALIFGRGSWALIRAYTLDVVKTRRLR
jgi:hypothetical protein